MNNIKEILTEARRLINQGWCQSVAALDAEGQVSTWYSDKACSFCMSGAIHRAARVFMYDTGLIDEEAHQIAVEIRNFVKSICTKRYPKALSLPDINDNFISSQKEALDILDASIDAVSILHEPDHISK